MKKILTLVLALSCLFMTACNNIEESTTESTSSHTTESTSTTNYTTESSTLSEDASTTTELTENTDETTESISGVGGYEIPDEYKNVIVGYDDYAEHMEFPSRILINQCLKKGYWAGDKWKNNGGTTLSYYSKIDGEAYVYCYDPLCDHRDCAVAYMSLMSGNFYYLNERLYYITSLKSLYSCKFDGTDFRVELKLFENITANDVRKNNWNHPAGFDHYIYLDETVLDETRHTFRYDVITKEKIDLTEATGYFIMPDFFYNGQIYGGDGQGNYYKCDLDFQNVEKADNPLLGCNYRLTDGSKFVGAAREFVNLDDGTLEVNYFGIQTYDMKTGEKQLISNETIGHTVSDVVGVTDKYYYFLAHAPYYYDAENSKRYVNSSGGKLYRVNRDGTNCICVYENTDFMFHSDTPIVIYEDTVLVYANMVAIKENKARSYMQDWYIGHLNADGTIDELEWLEVID